MPLWVELHCIKEGWLNYGKHIFKNVLVMQNYQNSVYEIPDILTPKRPSRICQQTIM